MVICVIYAAVIEVKVAKVVMFVGRRSVFLKNMRTLSDITCCLITARYAIIFYVAAVCCAGAWAGIHPRIMFVSGQLHNPTVVLQT